MATMAELKAQTDAAIQALQDARDTLRQAYDAVLAANEQRTRVLVAFLDGNATQAQVSTANTAVSGAVTSYAQVRASLGL